LEECSTGGFSPSGRFIISYGDNTTQIWDSQYGLNKSTFTLDDNKTITSSCIAPDDEVIAITCTSESDNSDEQGLCILYDLNTNIKLFTLDAFNGGVTYSVFAPPSSVSSTELTLLTICTDATVSLFNARTGILLQTFKGHTEELIGATFSPSGDQCMTWSWDGTARLWDTDGDDECIILNPHSDAFHTSHISSSSDVNTATFSPGPVCTVRILR